MEHINKILTDIKEEGLFKRERTITTPQSVEIRTRDGDKVLNFCANNYLGLANHPDLINTAKSAMDDYGFGMASVRFICGTQDIHKVLEDTISKFFDTDDAILYTSCFDANGRCKKARATIRKIPHGLCSVQSWHTLSSSN